MIGDEQQTNAFNDFFPYTFKQYNAAELNLVINRKPSAGAVVQPVNDAVISTTSPTLVVSAGSDADGDALRYAFRVWSGNNSETGQIANSGWLPVGTTSWRIPAGTLRDGTTYCWLVYTWDQQYSWNNGSITGPGQHCFKVDLRLGLDPVSPTDKVGPVSVNLATGNVSTAVESAKVPVVGGELGVSFTYNSQAESDTGLRGEYFNDVNDNRVFDDAQVMEHTDPAVSFNWGLESPGAFVSPDKFLVRWTGHVTVPSADQWVFGVTQDDGVRIYVDNVLHLDRWFDQAGGINGGGPAVSFPAGGLTKLIRVEYFENLVGAQVLLYAKRVSDSGWTAVPSSWLSRTPTYLPTGWTMSGPTGGAAFTALAVKDNVTLRSADGSSYEYKKVPPSTGSTPGFTPPAGVNDHLALNADGTYTLHAADGLAYVFSSTGTLTAVQSASMTVTPLRPPTPGRHRHRARRGQQRSKTPSRSGASNSSTPPTAAAQRALPSRRQECCVV